MCRLTVVFIELNNNIYIFIYRKTDLLELLFPNHFIQFNAFRSTNT